MLSPQLEEFELGGDVRPALRDAQTQIRQFRPGLDGITYDRLFYQGPAGHMKTSDAQSAFERINGIDDTLSKTNPEITIVAREFRGHAAISHALNSLKSLESEISIEYDQLEKQVNSRLEHVVAAIGAVQGLMPYWRWKQRRGPELNKLRVFISSLSTDSRKDDIFLSMSGLLIPATFHHALIQADTGEALTQGRRDALREWGMLLEPEMVEALKMSVRDLYVNGFPQRKHMGYFRMVFLDQIAYFDKRTNEPVWLSIYRAHRTYPTPRKSRVHEPLPQSNAFETGALVPVPNR